MENDNEKNKEQKVPQEVTYHVEGLGTVTYVGELDVEKLIKRLLKSKYITGE
ncbi:hypothetical protein [Neobacillus vireti]|uniref:hypothetical protein n=1 Tax=Neobacillus vireti TaxID=220686 RepID=UPI002FFFB371